MGKSMATRQYPAGISKDIYLKLFETVIVNSGVGVLALDLVNEDTVLITFIGNVTKRVNIAIDSRVAILIDILEAIK